MHLKYNIYKRLMKIRRLFHKIFNLAKNFKRCAYHTFVFIRQYSLCRELFLKLYSMFIFSSMLKIFFIPYVLLMLLCVNFQLSWTFSYNLLQSQCIFLKFLFLIIGIYGMLVTMLKFWLMFFSYMLSCIIFSLSLYIYFPFILSNSPSIKFNRYSFGKNLCIESHRNVRINLLFLE